MGFKHIGVMSLTFQGYRGHVTIRFSIGNFLLVVLWNQASICNGFRDIHVRIFDMTLHNL